VINWLSITRLLSERLREPLLELQAIPLSGGNINQAFRLFNAKRQFFAKFNRAELLPMFEAEKIGLDEIRRSQSIRVPQVFATGVDGDRAFIVMEYIELGGPADSERLAIQLAAMHGCYHRQFGFHCDNTIGSTLQPNPFSDNWVEFWQQHRLGIQLSVGARGGFDVALLDAGQRLNENMGKFFQGYEPKPSLLHGDLWSGNMGSDSAGNPVVYDPACYYGDHEADLAMMELFGNPGPRFFSLYDEIFAIDDAYPLRRDLYNLYHLLNHANLFGGGYAGQSLALIKRLLAQV
jgi:fructosamine-3-kinase